MLQLNNAKQELDFTKTGEDAQSLIEAVQEAAAVYKSLHMKALSAGIKVPRSATIVSNQTAVWSKDDLIGAQDWMTFDNKGWALVDDLPDLPEGFERTFYLAQELGDPPAEIVPVSAPLVFFVLIGLELRNCLNEHRHRRLSCRALAKGSCISAPPSCTQEF